MATWLESRGHWVRLADDVERSHVERYERRQRLGRDIRAAERTADAIARLEAALWSGEGIR